MSGSPETGGGAPSRATRPIQVLVVDDSAVVRQVLLAIFGRAPDMVVTAAPDPIVALSKIAASRPDVILLDLEMPRMDGLTFLRKVMAEDPIPVVVCSAWTGPGTKAAMQALEEGAVSVVAKPGLGIREFLQESAATMLETVRAAAQARLHRRSPSPGAGAERRRTDPRTFFPSPAFDGSDRIVAMGASIGGTEALRQVLEAMPPDAPPLVVVQHMPGYFTGAFARRLDEICRITVREAEEGNRLLPGCAFIAPGDFHTRVVRDGACYRLRIEYGPAVCGHRPSVGVLFHSMAEAAGARGIGVILTGMGEDGADGLAAMRRAGAHTIAQDEASCVVFGMPREAIRRGAVIDVAPLSSIPRMVLETARRSGAPGEPGPRGNNRRSG